MHAASTTCTVTLDDSLTVVARFGPFRLIVYTDAATVTRSQQGRSCGGIDPCTALYDDPTEVVLTASPDTAGQQVEWTPSSWCEPEGGEPRSPVCRPERRLRPDLRRRRLARRDVHADHLPRGQR